MAALVFLVLAFPEIAYRGRSKRGFREQESERESWIDGWMDGRMDGWMDGVLLCLRMREPVYLEERKRAAEGGRGKEKYGAQMRL
jgi:hypothetical protein